MFPTIFTMSLRGLGIYTKSGSSFLVMAIIGGAVFRCSWVDLAREHHQHGVCRARVCFAVVFLFGGSRAATQRRDDA